MEGDGPDEGIGLLSGAPTPPPKKAESAPAAGAAPAPAAVATVAPPRPDLTRLVSLVAAEDSARPVTAGTVTTISAVLTSRAVEPLDVTLTVEIGYTSTYPGEGAEWPVSWTAPGKRGSSELFPRKEKFPVHLVPSQGVPLSFEVTAPVGVRYGDRVELIPVKSVKKLRGFARGIDTTIERDRDRL